VSPDFRRIALIAASLGLILSLFFALRSGDEQEQDAPPSATTTTAATVPPEPTVSQPPVRPKPPPFIPVSIELVGGAPKDGIERASVKRGQKVRLFVSADVTDHVHLHGYDLTAGVAPGKPAVIAFEATIPGRFEVELEDRGVQIADLEVRP